MAKIALIINSLGGGGAEKVVVTLANYFCNHHSVTVITLDDIPDAYLLDSRVNKVRLKQKNIIMQTLELWLFFLKNPFDKHISFLLRANITNSISALFSGRRAVISERTNSYIRYKGISGILKKILLRLSYSCSYKIIAISKGVALALNNLGIKESKIKVIYNPCMINEDIVKEIRTKRMAFQREITDSVKLVTVGRVIESKNQIFLINLINELNKKNNKNYTLKIIGDGDKMNYLKSYASTIGQSQNIEFVGWSRAPEKEMIGSDIFVFSSLFEGFGNVLVESLTLGIPTVSFDCKYGPSEIFDVDLSEQLCPINDMKNFLIKVERLVEDDDYRRLVTSLSIKRGEYFDIQKVAKDYLSV